MTGKAPDVSVATLLLQGGAVAATVETSANDVGGQVTGDDGPEAGV